ncbi:MAG: glycosyltransferase [Chitinophagaceae bacterium]
MEIELQSGGIQGTVIKGKDIVIVSIQPWYYELGSNCKNIATQFSKHNRVLYINSPLTRKTYLSGNKSMGVRQHCEIIKKKTGKIKKINDNMWEYYPASLLESINWVPFTGIFKPLNYINSRRFAKDIKDAIQTMNFKDIILFNDNNIYNGFHLKELLSPAQYIYYCRDFLQGYDFYKPHSQVLEPELIKKADLVVANSTFYTDYCSGFNKNSHYIGQGCNTELFDNDKPRTKPEDITPFSSPIIGYVGALDSARLDVKIVETIALANPAWNVVLVGPEDDFFEKSELHKISNVHFLGRKPLLQLPDYVASFDVCINPQKINPVTHGNYPLKIDEYLAMGKPVVATRTIAMKLFEDFTGLADKPEDYPGLIEKAILENNQESQQKRIAFGRSHTWENSMRLLYDAMKSG